MFRLIATMFRVRYSIKVASVLLHQMGWMPQMPSHRAIERNEAAMVAWRRHKQAAVKGCAQTGRVDSLRRRGGTRKGPHLA
jgi:uncharacterized membrane-anchored protein